jgi:hypothetical protein
MILLSEVVNGMEREGNITAGGFLQMGGSLPANVARTPTETYAG